MWSLLYLQTFFKIFHRSLLYVHILNISFQEWRTTSLSRFPTGSILVSFQLYEKVPPLCLQRVRLRKKIPSGSGRYNYCLCYFAWRWLILNTMIFRQYHEYKRVAWSKKVAACIVACYAFYFENIDQKRQRWKITHRKRYNQSYNGEAWHSYNIIAN